ncbi:MAG: Xaa-Pro peptidase family protein [Solirubrobacteraceae bacterium]
MSDRAARLAVLLDEAELDLLLVTNLVNVRYLTGYTGSNGLALVGPETRLFVTDFRYVEQAAVEVEPSFERRRSQFELFDALTAELPTGDLRMGFDDANLTVRQHARLGELLPGRVELVGAAGLVERLRAIKDPEETEYIRAAAAVADAALTHVLEAGLAGRSEREFALALETAMREQGAQRPSFDAIVAAGPHGALPHATPRDVAITSGELVVIDWGAEVDGYCSDCTRTLAAGEPTAQAREVYELVLSAQLTGLEAVRAGADGRAVDAAARAVIEAAGHGDNFGHGLGHGVGAEIHEAPRLSARSEDELQSGNVVTVEPGVYLSGQLGVRIEDLVVVTDEGCEILTSLDKTLRVIG